MNQEEKIIYLPYHLLNDQTVDANLYNYKAIRANEAYKINDSYIKIVIDEI